MTERNRMRSSGQYLSSEEIYASRCYASLDSTTERVNIESRSQIVVPSSSPRILAVLRCRCTRQLRSGKMVETRPQSFAYKPAKERHSFFAECGLQRSSLKCSFWSG